MEETTTFTKEMVIGDILNARPSAAKIIEKYFGEGCFTCPGIAMETIAFGASMHGVDAEQVIKDINGLND